MVFKKKSQTAILPVASPLSPPPDSGLLCGISVTLSHLTSLSREASRCRDLRSDMRKWRVVSAEGWGPGVSGANCTFLMMSRTEFLLWLFSSSDLAQKARISKLTPQAFPVSSGPGCRVMEQGKF